MTGDLVWVMGKEVEWKRCCGQHAAPKGGFCLMLAKNPMPLSHHRLGGVEHYWALLNALLNLFLFVQLLNRVWLFVTPWTAACLLLCPSVSPRICLNSGPLSQWYHPTISSSVARFSPPPLPIEHCQMQTRYHEDFADSSADKESTCNAGDPALIPGLRRSPGRGHGNPSQYSFLENPHGQRSLAGFSPWGHNELDMTERVRTHTGRYHESYYTERKLGLREV